MRSKIEPRRAGLKRVNPDTTVETKAVRFSTAARLYRRCRERLSKTARREGVAIKESYRHVDKRLLLASSRYAYASQMKRACVGARMLRMQLGRVIRDIERQVTGPPEMLSKLQLNAHRIYAPERREWKRTYSVHEPR